ncbi:YdcF family protein [Paucisalibacillus sp. EB02]|uniref:YdcF family protein n=1 Tax=Paucisalibacillus sp. EB02 TaxID=1347087 RepID=UPI000694BE34|nr:YdcF family protein [Paucisalibacillus sp. EB02]
MAILFGLCAVSCFLYVFSLIYVSGNIDFGIIIITVMGIVFLLLAIFHKRFFSFLRKKRWLRYMVTGVLVISVITIMFFEILMYQAQEDSLPSGDVPILVLGAGLINGEPSPTLKRRLNKAYDIYQQNPTTIVTSGGVDYNEEISEGEAMKRYLVSLGVEPTDILVEDKSTSTHENFLFSKELLAPSELKPEIIVITNDFHMFRAKMIGGRVGFTVYAAPSETPKHILVQAHIREYFAIINTYLFQR